GLASSGAVFVTGAATAASATPGVLAKYDSLGNLLWSRQFPHGLAITVDATENVYSTGYGIGSYGDITITNTGAPGDFFVAKCDSTGQLVWVRQAGSVTYESGQSVGLDALGNVYVGSV